MLHYAPQHVSNSTLLIFRRTNCITTTSGIVTLCKQPYSMQVQSALHLHTVRLLREGDDTRSCGDTIGPPEDKQRAARNMLRIVVQHTYCWKIKELCIKLVIWKSLYCDARSEKHQTLWPVSKAFETALVSYNVSWSSLYIKSNRPVVCISTIVAVCYWSISFAKMKLLYKRLIPCSAIVYVIKLCGLVVRVSGCRYRGLGFNSRLDQIFLSSSGSGTGSTQPREPREVNWGATWIKK